MTGEKESEVKKTETNMKSIVPGLKFHEGMDALEKIEPFISEIHPADPSFPRRREPSGE